MNDHKRFETAVYVAGPLGAAGAGRARRVQAAIEAGEQLAAVGFLPFVPHLFHFVDELSPAPYEEWMARCFAWLDRCDVVLRISGASPGADREVAYAEARGIQIFHNVDELVRLCR